MRLYRRLRFDLWLCLLAAYLVSMGTGTLASSFSAATYADDSEVHTSAPGEAGSVAGPEVPRAESIAELLTLDTFTVLSHGIAYRNEGAGFFAGGYLYNLELPSGERVAARINTENVQKEADSDVVVLPVGQVVWADLEEDSAFLAQITSGYPLDRTDFYVDMVGASAHYSEEDRTENIVMVVQLITLLICFPILHALGSHFGIFPAFFHFKGRRGTQG